LTTSKKLSNLEPRFDNFQKVVKSGIPLIDLDIALPENTMTKRPSSVTSEQIMSTTSIFIITWLSFLAFGGAPANDALDPSWTQGLGYAFKHNFQAGIDYIFTFGPLGYLSSTFSSYDSDLFYSFVLWQILNSFCFAVIFIVFSFQLPHRTDRFVYLALTIILLTIYSYDTRYFLGMIASVSLLLRPPPMFTRTPFHYFTVLNLVLLWLAIAALTKFSNFILANLAMVSLAVGIFYTRSRWQAVLIPVIFGLFLIISWRLTGQALTHLPLFIKNSILMTSNYNEGMSFGFNVTAIQFALTAMGTMTLLLLLSTLSPPMQLTRTIIATFILLVLFITWKAGFILQESYHFSLFFTVITLLPFLVPLAEPMHRTVTIICHSLRYATIVAGLTGLFIAGQELHYAPKNFIGHWNQRVVENFMTLVELPSFKSDRDITVAQFKHYYNLPLTRALVGTAPVDIFSWEQGILLLNELNWQPRPIFQSYAAYNSALLALNGDFYASAQAPPFVIFKYQEIDNRFPPGSDSEALKILLRDYYLVLVEKDYIVLKRDPRGQGRVADGQTLLSQSIKMGEVFDLSAVNDKLLLLKLDIQKSWWGHLVGFLYRVPRVTLELETTTGAKLSYRLITQMAHSSFLISPLLIRPAHIFSWYANKPLRRVAKLRVVVETGGEYFFNDQMVVQVNEFPITRRLPPSP